MFLSFAVDCMLGRLAKNLRIMGFDTFYNTYIEDGELVDLAVKEDRILLTMDRMLVKRKKLIHYHLLTSQVPDEQTIEIINHYNLKPLIKPFTRCINCNVSILTCDKDKVKGLVPIYVYQTQNHYSICPKCQKIFWGATHKKNMTHQIEKWLKFIDD